MTLPNYVQQPGPDGPAYTTALTRLVDLEIDLPADVSLHDSLAQAISARGLAGAYIRITNAEMSRLHYVIPGLAPDDTHVAWYSKTYKAPMPGKIVDAGITCGTHNEKPFYHCHGLISDAAQTPLMGHLLPEQCVPSKPTRVTGFGFKDARFSRNADAQTGFELFSPEQVAPVPEGELAVLLRISPNVEISKPLIKVCRDMGWKRASAHGVGSTIGAHFDDGRIMDSFATELMINNGIVDLRGPAPQVDLDISLVGLGGSFMQGRLKASSNPVLITAEIILKRAG